MKSFLSIWTRISFEFFWLQSSGYLLYFGLDVDEFFLPFLIEVQICFSVFSKQLRWLDLSSSWWRWRESKEEGEGEKEVKEEGRGRRTEVSQWAFSSEAWCSGRVWKEKSNSVLVWGPGFLDTTQHSVCLDISFPLNCIQYPWQCFLPFEKETFYCIPKDLIVNFPWY